MKVIIPAAGYATRLFPLTKNQPKALLEVSGKSILEHCLDKIEELGNLDEVFVVTNNKFTPHFERWHKTYKGKLNIEIINDGTMTNNDRLGALGDLQLVIDKKKINDDILVMAGDNLFEDSLFSLYGVFTKKQRSSISIYDIGNIKKASSFGVIDVDTTGQVIFFEEKPKNPKSSLVSTMIYFIKKEDIGTIKICIKNGKQDNGGELISELVKNTTVYSSTLKGYRYDIGNKDQLAEVRKRLG